MSEAIKAKGKKYIFRTFCWVAAAVMVITAVNFFRPHNVEAATSGQMTQYFHKENSGANETYNAMTYTPTEADASTITGVATTNVNATPPTSFCEASTNTANQYNSIETESTTGTPERCMATFISAPLVGASGGSISLATGDTASITGQFWHERTHVSLSITTNIYIYRWNGTGTTVNSADRIATLSCANPASTAITQCNPTAVSPANNVTFSAGDRLVAIVSIKMNSGSGNNRDGLIHFDSSARISYIRMSYTSYAYNSSNKPSLAGTLDDDFTTDSATTACTTSGTAYNTKWTCLDGSAANTTGSLNAGGTSGTINGDTSDWLWIRNSTDTTGATVSNFGGTPSNTYIYQTLPAGYGNGNITTVANASHFYNIGTTPTNSPSPYSHTGLVLWLTNTDYLELQVYADSAINDSGTNNVKVALNNSGTLSGATNLNTGTTGNQLSNIWLRFDYSNGAYQAQYSTDGASFSNVGSSVTHDAFLRTGLNAFAAIANPTMDYAGAFEWFASTLAAVSYNQSGYQWFANANSTAPGAANGSNNTAYTTLAAGENFRLRMLLRLTGQINANNAPSYKLQYVDKGAGTCASPSGGTPASYTDVTTGTLIAYFNNATPADGANISSASGDPADAGATGGIVYETYEEANNFSATQNNITHLAAGMWDFSLVDNGAAIGATYCFRAVNSDGTNANYTYGQYPQITMASIVVPTTDQLMHHGGWFNGGAEQSYYWAN